MGQSTDAYLAYGIDIGELEGEHQYDLPSHYDNKGPVGMVLHCSDNCPMGIIALSCTVQRAWRGDPLSVDMSKLAIGPAADKLLKEFCEEHKLEYKQPGWLLFSYWG
jgi:hypothetical protein